MIAHQENNSTHSDPNVNVVASYVPEILPLHVKKDWTTADHLKKYMSVLENFEKEHGRLPMGREATTLHMSISNELPFGCKIASAYHEFTTKLVTLFHSKK